MQRNTEQSASSNSAQDRPAASRPSDSAVHPRGPARPEWRIDLLGSPEAFFERQADLELLAANALEPNIFHEPFFLFPALRSFGQSVRFRFLLVYGTPGGNPKPPMTLRVFLPLHQLGKYRGMPVSQLRSWTHVHCFLGTPLLSRNEPEQALHQLFDWLAESTDSAPVLEIPLAATDGPVFGLFAAECHRRNRTLIPADIHARAVCRPTIDSFHYIRNAISGDAHKEHRRKLRRLADLGGSAEFRYFSSSDDVAAWTEDFLRVEGSGWKGAAGSALGASPENREFFSAVVRGAAERNRLMMLRLEVGGKSAAVKCNFLAQPGSFAFKIGYDESLRAHSPGQILELENIRALCDDKPAEWMDSCADADHPMINRFWTERRLLATWHLATGRTGGDWAVSSLPLLKWLKSKWSRKRSKR